MKRSDTLLKIMSALVFCAMIAYLAFYVVDRLVDPVQTALAVTASMTDSSAVSGLVVRDELVVSSDAEYINVTVSDGEKVSAGEAVAVVYDSAEALERASRMDSLSREIEDVQAALSSTGGLRPVGNRESSIYDAIRELSASIRSDGYAGVDTKNSALASLIFRGDTTDATEEYLSQLQTEYMELQVTAAGETEEITVGMSGTFSTVVDGYEGVDPEYAEGLAPSSLREIIAADRVVEPHALGKLITSYKWYYAAIVGREDASRLVAGMTVRMSFGRYYSEFLTARVVYVGQAEGDEQLVLFSMDRGFADMLAVRAVSAEIVYSEYTGLRVPLKGLYRYYAGYMSDEDGAKLTEGGTATLSLGGVEYAARVSEVGSAQRYGDLPEGIEPGSEADTRPTRRQVVFYWPWTDEPAPDFSSGGGAVTLPGSDEVMAVMNFYDYDQRVDRMCVFTMTGLQAERKKVDLIFAGEEYALVSSAGDDALREGNEIIVQAANLHNGKVFR